ncbi:Pyridoxal phosphate phosphatase YigL [Buchnera aphidicola (Pemphigus populi)]
MYNIIVSDLDGTLLSSEYKITDYTKKIIQILYQQGFFFVFATGRHYFDVLEICNYCEITAFMITSNGAQIYNLDKHLIFACDIKSNVISNFLQNINLDTDVVMQMYCKNQWYIDRKNIKKYFFYQGSYFKHQVVDFDCFKMDNVSKIFFTSNNRNKLSLLKKEIMHLFKEDLNISFSSNTCLEIMSKKVSKGNALIFLMKYLNFSLKNCITFGNAMNDIEMLKISGKACIVQNSDLALKNKLPYVEVIGSNDNNGVACYLDSFLKK